ncbi:hypothetical protein [Paenibacillus woosongensis]|uniref:Uncharacterized protein n=1 Tax=Paenibacillus woosongensis TaxID=307580 RepID=A0A7X2Z334_9BACL|nr:hypothetical protein [Paenibacillus woosongensis]MUG46118.1 hypothetical protein [Paenibacillus woosongensis]
MSGRQSDWHGMAQSLQGKLTAGRTYDISAAIRQERQQWTNPDYDAAERWKWR